jgi:hypothetical protein
MDCLNVYLFSVFSRTAKVDLCQFSKCCYKSLSLSHFFKARALKEIGEFEDAVKTLETAEMISKEHTAVIQKYKTEVIMAQKEAFLNQK